MGVDAGFDLVPRLSQDTVEKEKWNDFITKIKALYESDDRVEFKENFIEFNAGEHPLLPYDGTKFLRFSSKVSGQIARETHAESYILEVVHVAKEFFGPRIRFWWDGDGGLSSFYAWRDIHKSIRSYYDMDNESSHQPATADPGSPLFEILDIPGKGRGLVARFDIPNGTRILAEKPLLEAHQAKEEGTRILAEKPLLKAHNTSFETLHASLIPKIKALSKDQQRQFLSLHNNFPGQYVFAGIMKTNALPLGSQGGGAVYPTICLANHSCDPNAHNTWNEDLGQGTLHAIRLIKAGEEITIHYDDSSPAPVRRAKLKKSFGFDCTCPVCSLPAPEIQASDARRARMLALDEAIGDSARMSADPRASLADCRELLRLSDEEYGAGGDVAGSARVFYDAFQVCVAHGDLARAGVFAERACRARMVCEGEDGTGTRKMKSLMENPAGHPSFGGCSKKWRSRKEDFLRGSLGDGEFERWLWRVK